MPIPMRCFSLSVDGGAVRCTVMFYVKINMFACQKCVSIASQPSAISACCIYAYCISTCILHWLLFVLCYLPTGSL